MPYLREVEYDPFTGITKKWYFTDDGKIVCHKTYEEGGFVEAARIRRHETAGRSFVNDSHAMHHMASLPPLVIEKILKDHGLNVMGDLSPSEQKKLHRIIETEYPYCKTHEKKLWRPTSHKRPATA